MFGKNIKKLRSVHGLSQQQFAEIFDLKRATLGAYEEQRSNPKMETVIKIANHFSIELEDLLTKELTVNKLLRFNEMITTTPAGTRKADFDGLPYVNEINKSMFIKAQTTDEPLELPKIVLPNISVAGKTAFAVTDMAMSGTSPTFLPNDIVIGQKIPIARIQELNNKLVVITTDTELLFRRLEFSNTAFYLRASQNGSPPIEITVNEVTGLWQIVHVFHFTIPQLDEVEQRLSALENKIAQMEKK